MELSISLPSGFDPLLCAITVPCTWISHGTYYLSCLRAAGDQLTWCDIPNTLHNAWHVVSVQYWRNKWIFYQLAHLEKENKQTKNRKPLRDNTLTPYDQSEKWQASYTCHVFPNRCFSRHCLCYRNIVNNLFYQHGNRSMRCRIFSSLKGISKINRYWHEQAIKRWLKEASKLQNGVDIMTFFFFSDQNRRNSKQFLCVLCKSNKMIRCIYYLREYNLMQFV